VLRDRRQLVRRVNQLHMSEWAPWRVQGYLELDVVESGFAKLKQAFATSQDFNVVRRAHDSYLQHLVTKAMLRHPVRRRRRREACVSLSRALRRGGCCAGDDARRQRHPDDVLRVRGVCCEERG
jgi:hypothetical protein